MNTFEVRYFPANFLAKFSWLELALARAINTEGHTHTSAATL